MTSVQPVTESLVERAATAWAAGHLVVFPTETVYGLGADALNPDAVAQIFRAKGRPADHPLIIHVASTEAAQRLAADWPEDARKLAEAFWPGPLTLILPKAAAVPMAVTGGQQTVGLRVPDQPVALALLKAFGAVGSGAVAAPSANRFGGVSPTRARDVAESLSGRLGPDDLILDGGDCQVGLESSIVDCTVSPPRLLRPGGIPREALEAVVSLAKPTALVEPALPRVSGSLESHYAPRTPLYVLPAAQLWSAVEERLAVNPKACLHVWAFRLMPEHGGLLSQAKAPLSAEDYGRQLYARLHDWDAQGFEALFLEEPPEGLAWEAVRDRLRRAAHETRMESRR